MIFDNIIDIIAKSFDFEIPDTRGFEYDIDDAVAKLGKTDYQKHASLMENPQVFDYKNMIQTHIILAESFSSMQEAKWAVASAIQSCYYLKFGAHHFEFNESELILRYVTMGSSMYIAGSIILSGNHYEKLFQEYQEFLKRLDT